MIPAGRLTKRIVLVDPGRRQDETGQVLPAENPDRYPTWAEREDRSGSVTDDGATEVGAWTTLFTVRYRSEIAGISRKWWIEDEYGRRNEIEHVKEIDTEAGHREGWRLYAILRQ